MGSHTIGGNKSNVRHRHGSGGEVQRTTHGGGSDPTALNDSLYSGSMRGESVGWQDMGQEVVGLGNIQADAITAREISVGMFGARNLLVNGGFRDGTTGWAIGGSGTAALSGIWSTSATDYTLRDYDADGATGTAAPWGSTAYIKNTANTGTLYWYQEIPITGGAYYSLSALLGNQRATSCYVYIDWLDTSYASVSTDTGNIIDDTHVGGPTRDLWGYSYIENVQAPTTASIARVCLFMNMPRTSGSDCYMFADQAIFTNSHKALPYVPQEEEYVRAAGGSVVINASGVTILNGALTVSSDSGATVIIDGTSNMFKIQASGTLNVTSTSTALNVSSVTLSALGTVTTAPANICFISGASASTSPKYLSPYIAGIAKGFVAATSGGAVTTRVATTDQWGLMDTVITASQVVVELTFLNETSGSLTIYGKYYVLVEAAV